VHQAELDRKSQAPCQAAGRVVAVCADQARHWLG